MTKLKYLKWWFLSLIGLKTLWEKEKMLVTSIFSFSCNVFKRLPFQGCEKLGLYVKELNEHVISCYHDIYIYRLNLLMILSSYMLLIYGEIFLSPSCMSGLYSSPVMFSLKQDFYIFIFSFASHCCSPGILDCIIMKKKKKLKFCNISLIRYWRYFLQTWTNGR